MSKQKLKRVVREEAIDALKERAVQKCPYWNNLNMFINFIDTIFCGWW